MVYDPLTRRIHHLNHSAALVFGLCDGTATVRQLAAEIADAYEMPHAELERQIKPLIRQLRDNGLLQGKRAATQEPEDDDVVLDERGRRRIVVPRST